MHSFLSFGPQRPQALSRAHTHARTCIVYVHARTCPHMRQKYKRAHGCTHACVKKKGDMDRPLCEMFWYSMLPQLLYRRRCWQETGVAMSDPFGEDDTDFDVEGLLTGTCHPTPPNYTHK